MHPQEPVWIELLDVLHSIKRRDVVSRQLLFFSEWKQGKVNPSTGKPIKPPVGSQSIINAIIDEKISGLYGWNHQIYVLKGKKVDSEIDQVPYWTMDFRKNRIGVEVSFNNAGAFAQNLLRLSVMSESKFLDESEMIKLGILIVPTESLKKWGSMDSTVITFEQVELILPHITFSIPTPIIVIGIDAADDIQGKSEIWNSTKLFGNKSIGVFEGSRKSYWQEVLTQEALSI